jgi:hypothetical protein
MNSLILNPEASAARADDKSLAVPALPLELGNNGSRQPFSARGLRRRFNVTRLRSYDSGFRPFRIY